MADPEEPLLSFTAAGHGDDWFCLSASPACRQQLGLGDGSATVLDLAAPADRTRLADALERTATSELSERLHVRLRTTSDGVAWFEVQVHSRGPGSGEVIVVLHRSDERQAVAVRDVVEGHRDSLTGAFLRPVLLDHATQALARLQRERQWVGLMFLDLDRLKHVNDTIGHQAGDAVLVELSRRVSALLRPGDTFARLGGDEFAVLIGDLRDPLDAQRLAKRIVAASRSTFDFEGVDLDCSVSVGLSVTSDPGQTTEGLLRQADVAMYDAKTTGRGRWRIWGVSDELRLEAERRVESVLAETLRAHSLVLDYQPIVRLLDDCPVGLEALLRVVGPHREVLKPSAFLDIATARRLIGPLDLQVLHRAFSDQHRQSPALPVDLNLATVDLEEDGWAHEAAAELLAHGDRTTAVRVELREDLLRGLSGTALQRLDLLRQHGVPVGVDNFGSDISAMSTLWSFPLDYVKLHASITAQLTRVRAARAMVRAVCELAHGLDLLVIASGVETPDQQLLARESGCDQAQGYLWPTSEVSSGDVFSPNGSHPHPGSSGRGP
jgi:diguanylate cyclase (GGDEF)-like protein